MANVNSNESCVFLHTVLKNLYREISDLRTSIESIYLYLKSL